MHIMMIFLVYSYICFGTGIIKGMDIHESGRTPRESFIVSLLFTVLIIRQSVGPRAVTCPFTIGACPGQRRFNGGFLL